MVVKHGIYKTSEMRTQIRLFVEDNFPNVSPENRSYYPLNRDILVLIRKYRIQAGIYYKRPLLPGRRIRVNHEKYKKGKKTGPTWGDRSCAEVQPAKCYKF